MDPRLYPVVDCAGVYRASSQSSDGVDLAAFYADANPAPPPPPPCHQLRSPRTASVVDVLEPTPNPAGASRDFVARAFYDGGAVGGRGVSTTGSFWDRRRASFLPADTMAPGVMGGYDRAASLVQGDGARSCRSDSVSGKDTTRCSSGGASSASITSSMTSSSSSLSRKKKPIGTVYALRGQPPSSGPFSTNAAVLMRR